MRAATKCLLALVPLMAIQMSHAEQFYKWVDEKGATHYTQTPPPEKKLPATTVKVSNKLPADSASAAKNLAALTASNNAANAAADKAAAKDQAAAAADAERRKGNAENCAKLQANVALLQSGVRVRSKDPKTQGDIMTDEQRASRIQQQTAQIQQGCPK